MALLTRLLLNLLSRLPHYLATTLDSLSAMLTRATTELASTAIDALQQELQDKIARCGRIAEPQPWYRRGRRFAKRLWSFSRPAVTTDPYIADIRRHVFGNSDCTPQACNTVKDADGNVVRHGCGHLFPAEEFRQHWHACPACHRPDPLDPSTYVDLVLEPDSFQEIYTNRTLEHIDGWTELYDYTAMRQKSTRQPAGNEALVIGHGRIFDDIPVALAVSNFAYMGGCDRAPWWGKNSAPLSTLLWRIISRSWPSLRLVEHVCKRALWRWYKWQKPLRRLSPYAALAYPISRC